MQDGLGHGQSIELHARECSKVDGGPCYSTVAPYNTVACVQANNAKHKGQA